MSSFDYIIVGGGLAGSVVAARLAEDDKMTVLVLEAGQDLSSDPRTNVPAMWPMLIGPDTAWQFKTVPQAGLGNREIEIPLGKVLGGSSGINGMSFAPSVKANVDILADLGNDGWDWESFEKSLAKSYSLQGDDSGQNGPIHVTYPSDVDQDPWATAWHSTLKTLGYEKASDIYNGNPVGSLTIPDTIIPESRTRSYAANAYLLPAKAKGNVTICTGVQVHKIEFSPSTSGEVVATGVVYRDANGETKTVTANKEIILTAGTLNTPKILELSGIGGADLLQRHGIDVVVDNPNVGENLQNHNMCSIVYQANPEMPTMDGLSRQDPEALAAAQAEYAKQTGPFASSNSNTTALLPVPNIHNQETKDNLQKPLSQNAATISSSATEAYSKVHCNFVQSILNSEKEASASYILVRGYIDFKPDGSMAPPLPGTDKYITIGVLLSHPLSRGSVHITDTTVDSNPIVDPKYLTHPLDIEVFARHLLYVEKIASTGALVDKLVKGGKRQPTKPLDNLDAAKEHIRDTSVGAHHFVGSCSMMSREMGGVVDSKLRVYGTRGLRVCDASVIPVVPRSNPQSTVYAFAEHAATIIKGDCTM